MVIKKSRGLRAILHDFPGCRFSITVLECEFSIQLLGDGFREGKTRWNRGLRPRSFFFLPCYRNPDYESLIRVVGNVTARDLKTLREHLTLAADARDVLKTHDSLKRLLGIGLLDP